MDVLEDKAIVFAVLAPRQFDAVTLRFPETNPAKNLTVTVVVPCPPMMVALAGAVHAYEVELATASMEYTWFCAEQTPAANPLIVPGVDGLAE